MKRLIVNNLCQSLSGRIILHIIVAIHHPRMLSFHLAGIRREIKGK